MIRKFFKYLISDPKKILKYIIKIFFLNKYQKKFKEHNYKIWKNWKINNTKNIILVDSFFIPEWIISSTYFVNVLAKKEDAKIFTFSQKKFMISQNLEILIM